MEIAHLKQVLTHRQVHGIFYECTGLKLKKGIKGFILTDQKDISTFALPGIIRTFIQKGHLLII
jgi:hypothetical protein